MKLETKVMFSKGLSASPEEVEADLALVDDIDLLQEVLPHLLAPDLQGPQHLPHPCTGRQHGGG